MKRTKTVWSDAEWIAYGNRVKQVSRDLHALLDGVQNVGKAKEIDGLLRVIRALDKWKSKMDSIACQAIPGKIATRIFYGEPIGEETKDNSSV